jgi:twitching motility protein PilU
MQIETWLRILAEQGGSDLYLSTGAPPCAKFEGQLRPIASMPAELTLEDAGD